MLSGKTVLVTGASGQVGHSLMGLLAGRCEVIATARAPVRLPRGVRFMAADLGDEQELAKLLRVVEPDVVFNPAAYTAVDKAEADEAAASRLNARLPELLAADAARRGGLLVHYSTDYVFDGSGDAPRDEAAKTAPLNAYGRTKLDGEERIRASGCRHLIFRTSWVYSDHGHNFVKTMLKLGGERDLLRVVADQVGAPTSAPSLAGLSIDAAAAGLQGTYHLASKGETSWHGFAVEIFAQARARGIPLTVQTVEPVPTTAYPTPARRPLNSRLDCGRFDRDSGLPRPTWQEALADVMDRLGP